MSKPPDLEEVSIEEISRELERRRRENPLENVYTPHEFQEKIHASRGDITLVLGGNRTGKSYSAVAEALFYCLGKQPYAETPEPPVTVWYVLPSLGMFRKAIIPLMRELCPPAEWANYSKQNHMLRFSNGSELHFVSADMRQRRLQGARVDLVVMDEAMQKEIFDELQARVLTTDGRILMVLTPVDEDASKWLWIRDDLYVPWKMDERKDIDVIHMPVADDEGNPLVPHLTREDIERLERMYPDPQVRAARMYGEFVERSGLVFGQYDPEVHVVPSFEVPENWHKWLICDPQYHRFAVLFFAADDKGNYYVIDEYFSQDEALAVRAERIKAMVGPQNPELPMYVDYANPQDVTELNYHFDRINADIGALQLPMQKRVDKMILKTHSMLEPYEDRKYHEDIPKIGGVKGAPRLMFFDSLVSTWDFHGRRVQTSRLLWEMKKLTWGKNGKPDKDSAGGGDCSDCLIYGCSIPAAGKAPQRDETWRERLEGRDVVLWEAIKDSNKFQNWDKRWIR